MRLRLTEALGAVVVLAVTIAACVIALAALLGCSPAEGSGSWPDSAEFTETQAGSPRFSRHETGLRLTYVIVDHETGCQYLCRHKGGMAQLTDADGSPLLVAEAGS